MPALSEEDRRHRLTIDWKSGGDGSLDNAFIQLAHVVLRDGAVIGREVGPNQPVAMADGQPGVAIADIISDAQLAALKSIQSLQAELAAAQQQVTALTTERDTLQKQIGAATGAEAQPQ